MAERVLCVDDEPNVLSGYKRHLRKQFQFETAVGGDQALQIIQEKGPFAVIVSDMQMPGMNGVELLKQVKALSANTVRMMLTGNADQQTAVEAVNEGHIFRFLNKPCPPEDLAKAIMHGIEQYRLITAEKELLEKTLLGSIKVLSEVLSLVNPTAFGRASRVHRLANQIAAELTVPKSWQLKIAALLSQVGCVTVPEETLSKVYTGSDLPEDEQLMFAGHPQIGGNLIGHIPRLEDVSRIIAYQDKGFDGSGTPADDIKGQQIPLGARILKVALDFDTLESTGSSRAVVLGELKQRADRYDPQVLTALDAVIAKETNLILKEVELQDLRGEMILAQDIVTKRGVLLVSKGQEVTSSLRQRLKNFAAKEKLNDRIRVLVPPQE